LEYISSKEEINIVYTNQYRIPVEDLGCVFINAVLLDVVAIPVLGLLCCCSSFLYGRAYFSTGSRAVTSEIYRGGSMNG
jgi:hypothetical protein